MSAAPEPAPELQTRGLDKSFGALHVTRAVDLDLAAGARLGLIGPNGAGKTTLVNLLTGTLRQDAGEILLGGERIERLPAEERVRRGLVRTHQINTLLPEDTPREHLAMAIAERDHIAWRTLRYSARLRDCREEAGERLAALGLGHAADRVARALAYGEQRLLEIAIALALKPRVLLLDEPAAGVPLAEAGIIHDTLDRLPADVAVLIIEHDMDLVFRFAREIAVLVQGALIRRAAPDEIAADPEVRAVYLGRSAAA